MADTSFLDTLIYGYRRVVNSAGAILPKRRKLKFLNAAFLDDEDNDTTTVIFPVLAEEVPGDDGNLLINTGGVDGAGGTVAATAKITLDAELEELVHSGRPRHQEEWTDFYVSGETSFARTQWASTVTEDASDTSIGTISIPAAEHGDCMITVVVLCTIAYTSSGLKGGPRQFQAQFKRTGGVLSLVGIDHSPIDQWTGTAVANFTADNPDNDSIRIVGGGIAATDIRWTPSCHIIVCKPPA